LSIPASSSGSESCQFKRYQPKKASKLRDSSDFTHSIPRRAKYYFIALGSLRETQAILDLSNQIELKKQADVLGAHLYCLCHSD